MEIPLTRNKVAQIDPEDWPLVASYTWHAKRDLINGRFYACAKLWDEAIRKYVRVSMHRLITGAGPGDMVDHKDAEATLDNRRRNLRLCSNAMNQQNIRARGGKSSFKGVSWNSQKACWKVAFRCHGRFFFVGYFDDEEEAARAYDAAVLPLAGEFARLNFPQAA